MRKHTPHDDWVHISHAHTIADIPEDQLPDRACRLDLMLRALTGEEIYAYTPFGSDQYILWVDDGSNRNDCRHNPADYAQQWEKEQQR